MVFRRRNMRSVAHWRHQKTRLTGAHLHPVRAASPSLRQSRRAAATWFLLRTPENPANSTHDSRNPENQDNRQRVYGQRANGECQCVLANHEVEESRAPPQQSAREAPGLRGERERKRASRLYPLASLHATHGSAV